MLLHFWYRYKRMAGQGMVLKHEKTEPEGKCQLSTLFNKNLQFYLIVLRLYKRNITFWHVVFWP
jgi:hypothetical protein